MEETVREELIAEAVASVDVAAMLSGILRGDRRYRFGAYAWLLAEGLEHTMTEYLGLAERRHVNGRELVLGLRQLARVQFGPLAPDVWRYWGIQTTRDWGEIVFNLIGAGLLQRNENDRIEDFDDVFDMSSEFRA